MPLIVAEIGASAKTLDEIYDFSTGAGDVFAISNNDLMYYNNSSNDYDIFEQPIILQSGYYQITLVNPQEGSTSSFRLGRYETNTTNTGGEAVQI